MDKQALEEFKAWRQDETLLATVMFTLDEDFGGINTDHGFRAIGKSHLIKEALIKDIKKPWRSVAVYRDFYLANKHKDIGNIDCKEIKDRMLGFEGSKKFDDTGFMDKDRKFLEGLEVVYVDGINRNQYKELLNLSRKYGFSIRGFVNHSQN